MPYGLVSQAASKVILGPAGNEALYLSPQTSLRVSLQAQLGSPPLAPGPQSRDPSLPLLGNLSVASGVPGAFMNALLSWPKKETLK